MIISPPCRRITTLTEGHPETIEWCPWEVALPVPDEPVEWCRNFGDLRPFVAAWREFDPAFNIAGLSWRPLSARLREVGIDG